MYIHFCKIVVMCIHQVSCFMFIVCVCVCRHKYTFCFATTCSHVFFLFSLKSLGENIRTFLDIRLICSQNIQEQAFENVSTFENVYQQPHVIQALACLIRGAQLLHILKCQALLVNFFKSRLVHILKSQLKLVGANSQV